MRIVFMGTPDFAVPSLRMLVEAGYEVSGVLTAPDRPSGRGLKLHPSPVKEYAISQGLKVLQPVKLRDPEFLEALKACEPDLMVVVAFRMLPEVVWSMPRLGTFNLHASLLPDYRGAAPINWVLINGETETGATTFFIDKEIDTGKILLQEKIEVPADWNAGQLHDRLMDLGSQLVLKTVQGLEAGTLVPQPQDEAGYLHAAPKIFKEDCEIRFDRPAIQLHHFIRGLSPHPGAWTTCEEKILKIFKARLGEPCDFQPGRLEVNEALGLMQVACEDRWLVMEELQLAGKKRMNVGDFLRGHKGLPLKLGT